MPDLPSGAVTLLFTDIEGSTQLLRRLGDAYAHVLADHHRLLRRAFAAHDGHEVDTQGDSFFVAFRTPLDAVLAAAQGQQALFSHPWPAGGAVRVRMGLHTGHPLLTEDRYLGLDVHQAARIEAAAHGGQVLLSGATAGLVQDRLPEGLELRGLGEHGLKDFDQPQPLFQLLSAGLPGSFPPLRTARPDPEWETEPAERAAGHPLIGREAELTRLRERLRAARAAHGSLALLAGEPGIGKTWLAEQLTEAARHQGVHVLWGRCWEGEGAPPFWPWLQVLRAYSELQSPLTLRAELGTGAADLAQLLPELRERFPDLPPLPLLEPESARFRLFEAVSRFLLNVSEARPLVLVLDDLHWADKASLLLLQFLTRDLGEARLLVVGTYRDTDLDRSHPLAEVLPSLRRAPAFERLLLHGLSREEVERLLAARAGHALDEAGKRLAEALQQETEGNPFFIGEVLRHLAESGMLRQQDGRWSVTVGSIAELGIPEGVREVIARRLSRLSEQANDALSQASVLGREFELAVLARMMNMDEETLDEALEEAVAARLLTARQERRGASYAFSHALIRQTLDEGLRRSQRRRLHARAAEAIEAIHARGLDRHVGVLALHYREAGAAADPEKAIAYSLRAGEQAAAAFAWDEAAAYWQAALELLREQGAEPERQANLLVRLGDLIFATEWGKRAQPGCDYLEAALALYAQCGLGRQAADVHVRLARFFGTYVGQQDLERALAHFHAARPVLEADTDEPDSASLGFLNVGLAHASINAFQLEENGPQLLGRAFAIGERLGDVDLQGQALAMRACWPMFAGRVGEAQALLVRAWELAWGRSALITSALIVSHAVNLGLWLLDLRAGKDWLERWFRQPATARAASQRARLRGRMAMMHWPLGELEAARQAANDAGGGLVAEYYLPLAQGDWVEARAAAERGAEWSRRGRDRLNQLHWLNCCAMAARLQGDTAAAETAWRAALASLGGDQYRLWELHYRPPLALLLAETGRTAAARAEVQRCRAIVANGEDWRGLLGTVERADAATLAAEGSLAEAEPVLARALATFEQYGLVWDEAETRLSRGCFLLQAGEHALATEQFDAAVEVYRRIGAGERWLERVQRLRGPREEAKNHGA